MVMKQVIKFCAIFLFTLFVVNVAKGQTPTTSPSPAAPAALDGITATMAIGEVINVDAANKQMTLKTKDGEIVAQFNDKTEYVRVQPGATSLKDATPIAVTEIGLGDRVLATGKVSDDKKSIPVKRIVLMTKADISKKNETERMEWRRRGITGRVTQVNISKFEVTIMTRGMMGEVPVTLVETGNAKFQHYPANSVKYSDVVDGTFYDLKVGDQVRALGTKSEDGKTFKPEKVLSGSFKTVAGTITAIDVEKGEVKIKDIENDKKILTVVIGKDATIRRLPQMMGMMGGGQPGQGGQGGGQQVVTRPPQQGNQGAQQNGQGGQGGQNGMRMGGGFDIDEMIERIPPVPITDLKVGDMIGASTSVGDDPTKFNAIKLLAGIEPLVRMQQMQNAQRQGMGGASPSLSLPGLDGIGP